MLFILIKSNLPSIKPLNPQPNLQLTSKVRRHQLSTSETRKSRSDAPYNFNFYLPYPRQCRQHLIE
jgi:hypothetical protein